MKVEGQSDLIKKGPAVLNTSMKVYHQAKVRKARNRKVEDLEEKIKRLESIVEELTSK